MTWRHAYGIRLSAKELRFPTPPGRWLWRMAQRNKNKPRLEADDHVDGHLPLLVIFLAAIALRAVHVIAMKKHYPMFDLFIGDAASYNDWAQKIAQKNGGSIGVFYQDPLYPYVLGTLYRIFAYSTLWVRWFQVLLGGLNCVLIAGSARRFFGKRAGWIAGGISAIYGIFIFYEGTL